VKDIARAQLEELQERRRELDEMVNALEAMVDACAGDDAARCPILQQLSAPSPRASRSRRPAATPP
jgi:MerR family gold-responsive transcriptional activator of gol and ges genes